MQPEPTPTDVSAVNDYLAGTPQPVAQPAPQPVAQPEAVTPQPSPASQPTAPSEPVDPFMQFAAPSEPVAPVETPAAPSEPVAPAAPVETPAAQPEDRVETYDEYIARIAGDFTEPETPDPEKIDATDPAAIKQFFNDLLSTAVAKAEANITRKEAIRTTENRLWNDTFNQYPSLRENKDLRDMVHSIRMADFRAGKATTPTQAAQKLLQALGSEYRRGVADNQVATTIESVQPTGGQSGAPLATSLDTQSALTAVQTGGEQALANILDQEIKAGRL